MAKQIIERNKTAPVNISLYKDQHARIDQLGKQWRTTRSATIRRIFEEWQQFQTKNKNSARL